MLGSILLTEQALDAIQIEVGLRAEDFYRPRHQTVFRSMVRLKEKAEPEAIDALTVCDDLRRAGELEQAGGEAYVHSLPTVVIAAGNVLHYARIVKEHALLRRLLGATREIQDELLAHRGDARELIERAERALFQIGHDDGSGELRSMDAVLHDEIDKLERLSRTGESLTGTPSGFTDLDDLTGGFQPGNLIVLAARPSMGKCLAAGTLVYDPRAGGRRPIADVVASLERREEAWVASLDGSLRLRPTRVAAGYRNGVKPVLRLVTRLGRTLEATANHPLLTASGWRALAELAPGDPIAVPRRLPRLGHLSAAPEDELRRLAPPLGRPARTAVAPDTRAGTPVLLEEERPARERAPTPSQLDLAWDAVASIEPIGEAETFDLTVPADHNFVAGEIVVHNSALATNLAENAAVKHGKPVALFSLEMSETELAQRFIASQARLSSDELRKGRVKGDRWPKVLAAVEKLARAPLYVDDSSDIGILEVRAKARRMHARQPLGLLIVDYLQLMRAEDGSDSRVEQVGKMSRGLKILARELDIPVIAVSQLSRAVEARPDKRPLLSDLRESGNIEQDSDLVMFIYRDEYYNRESERPGEADVIISKHRNGPIGQIVLAFQPRYPKFTSIYREPTSELSPQHNGAG